MTPAAPLALWRHSIVVEFDDLQTTVRDHDARIAIHAAQTQPFRMPAEAAPLTRASVAVPLPVPATAPARPQRRRATALLAGLGLTVLALLIGPAAFYRLNHSWLRPEVVSGTDERVLALHAQLAQQSVLRERLFAERATLVASLEDTSRIITLQEAFQAGFARSLRSDLQARRAELTKLEQLTRRYLDVAPQIAASRHDATDAERAADAAQSNLALVERKVELEARTHALARQTAALHKAVASLRDAGAADELSYDVLRLEQEYHRSVAEAARARDHQEALRRGIAAIDAAIEEYDRLLGALKQSPYLQALEHNLTLAFVPYENLSRVRTGSPLYGCRVEMLGCRRVGQVVGAVGGEVSSHDRRGVLVQLALDDPGAAQREVLFAGRRPLFL
ncbi:MAG TPA: hypothetical protein VKN99_10800 [Polyangia bacterium]|nr:hypothetical protein [Polyangia bacterium]